MRRILFFISLILFATIAYSKNQQIPTENTSLKSESIDKLKNIDDSLTMVEIQLVHIDLKTKADTLKLEALLKIKTSLNNRKNVLLGSLSEVEDRTLELSLAVLIFGLAIIISILLFQRSKPETANYHPFKLIGIMFIGTISVFLVPAGFSNSQITPIIGLLGTIAGYLVSSTSNIAAPIYPNPNPNPNPNKIN